MNLKVGQNQEISYNYNNKRNVNNNQNSFSKILNDNIKNDSIKLDTSTNNVNNIYNSIGENNSMTDDQKQTLIEDKAVYDSEHLKEKGIEFGSPEWEDWKKGEGSACIPRLNEPWQIRRSWRKAFENCKTPAERKEVMNLKLTLFGMEGKTEEEYDAKVSSPNRLQDYLKYIGSNKEMYEDIAKHDLSHSYKIFISTLGKLQDEIINNIK